LEVKPRSPFKTDQSKSAILLKRVYQHERLPSTDKKKGTKRGDREGGATSKKNRQDKKLPVKMRHCERPKKKKCAVTTNCTGFGNVLASTKQTTVGVRLGMKKV